MADNKVFWLFFWGAALCQTLREHQRHQHGQNCRQQGKVNGAYQDRTNGFSVKIPTPPSRTSSQGRDRRQVLFRTGFRTSVPTQQDQSPLPYL